MFRKLTRGIGEKTQIRTVRTSNYPQVGLKELKLPTPEAVGNAASLTKFSNNSFDNPVRLTANNTLYKKADKGNGLQRLDYNATSTANSWLDSPANKFKGKATSLMDTITSFGESEQLNRQRSFAVVSPRFSVTPQFSFSPGSTIRRVVGSGALFDIENAFFYELFKGGVVSSFVRILNNMAHNNFVSGHPRLRSSMLTRVAGSQSIFFNEILIDLVSQNKSALALIGSVKYFGDIKYFQINTNQHRNAAWLLSQKTQYQFSKF